MSAFWEAVWALRGVLAFVFVTAVIALLLATERRQ